MFDLGGNPSDVGSKCSLTHIHQGSLDYPFGGDETVQMYGSVEEIPSNKCIVLVGDRVTPVHTYAQKYCARAV